ncbi:3-dehydroquinate dehydratase II [Labilithrix luteola]|uniref:3-dehydroquinate dehydratase n=1 Tax=Labilithrix luteola TaxID=1391654 RepID=A0A0K1Q7S3_9BACT|nr:type II 3-dehydroquinate dehydratase [Labilithrix luteola]AKV01460.1 3-dehydroquinate dehydratase II [Labilithrix luteola]
MATKKAVAKPSASKKATRPNRRRVLVLSGPNLQLLGTREPEIYGRDTLDDIHARLVARGSELRVDVDTFQSNHEGALLDRIGGSRGVYDGLLLNAGAYTHTSLALFDALKAVGVPCIEVHVSNPEAREAYRHKSMVAPACVAKISGFGPDSYVLALEGLVRWLDRRASR